eukprot:5914075-Prymnesium_polylepis.1
MHKGGTRYVVSHGIFYQVELARMKKHKEKAEPAAADAVATAEVPGTLAVAVAPPSAELPPAPPAAPPVPPAAVPPADDLAATAPPGAVPGGAPPVGEEADAKAALVQ